MVKACSRLRTPSSGGGESRSSKKIRRLNRHVGSTPISGTTSSNNNNPSAAGALPFQISDRKFLFAANADLVSFCAATPLPCDQEMHAVSPCKARG